MTGGDNLEDTAYLKMLTYIYLHRIVNRRTVYLLFTHEQRARAMMQRAVTRGHVTEHTVVERCRSTGANAKSAAGKYTHKRIAYEISKEGTVYLFTHSACPWFGQWDETGARTIAETVPPLPRNRAGQEGWMNVSQTSRAQILSALAGAEVSLRSYQNGPAELPVSGDAASFGPGISTPGFLRAFLGAQGYRELRESLGQEIRQPSAADYIRYYDNYEVKERAGLQRTAGLNTAGTGAFQQYLADYQRGRNRGILESRYKTCLLYCADSFGYYWMEDNAQVDKAIYELWRRREDRIESPAAHSRSGDCAVMICSDANNFGDICNNRRAEIKEIERVRRKSGERAEKIRNGIEAFKANHTVGYTADGRSMYSHFYFVPEKPEGVELLRFLMGTADSDFDREIAEDLIGTLGYTRNTGAAYRAFPLVTGDGRKAAVAIRMDYVLLREMKYYIENVPGRYAVLILSWQWEYYRKVLPEFDSESGSLVYWSIDRFARKTGWFLPGADVQDNG